MLAASPSATPSSASLWREWLVGAPDALDLPLDRPRGAVQRYREGRLPVVLAPPLVTALRELTPGEDAASLRAALIAAFAAALLGSTGQESLLLGLAGEVAEAARSDLAVLRLERTRDCPMPELLRGVRGALERLRELPRIPFPALAEAVSGPPPAARHPLVQAVLALSPARRARDLQAGEAAWTDVSGPRPDLVLSLAETPAGGLGGTFEHDAGILDRTTVARLFATCQRVASALARCSTAPLGDLLTSPAERHALLCEWNDTSRAGEPALIPELIEAQVPRTPEAVALVSGDERLTYAELDHRAEALARRLRSHGAGPERCIGVATPRGPEMVVSLLAVHKSGSYYLALDPGLPRERLDFLLRDARVDLVVSAADAGSSLATSATRVLRVDREADLAPATGGPGTAPGAGRSLALAGNLSHLIYTSGSTGRPKGVAIQHASVASLVAWAAAAFEPAELRGMLASTSIAFDLSVFELFVPLALGGTVFLAEDALSLAELPAAAEVTFVNTVPSAMAALLAAGAAPPALHTVGLAGEPITEALAERVLRESGARRLVNLYGPSEATTYSLWTAVAPEPGRSPAIGRPIDGTRVYLLDARLGAVPLGAVGEICLAGTGLARGYLRRPGLTAGSFVPAALGGASGERLYRTGDLGRFRSDGRLDFLGRRDHQVKVRGFRIELGEVEAALLRHPAVTEAVLVARGAGASRRLVAFVTLGRGLAASEDDLRRFLADQLPAYMVPASIHRLDRLPRNPNGKVDRAALAGRDTQLDGALVGAPRPGLERRVIELWCEVLDRTGIGRDDDFFALGGTSLSAMMVVARLRRDLAVDLAPAALFDAPTPARLAAAAAVARRVADARRGVPLRAGRRDLPLPLSFAQEELWLLDRLEPGSPWANVTAALAVAGGSSRRSLAGALRRVSERHEALRTVFRSSGGVPFQQVLPAVPLALPLIDLSALPAADREREARGLASVEARRGFDLEHGPLVRTVLLARGEGRRDLLLTLHHIVADGWSVELLAREIEASAAAGAADAPTLLPQLPVQYADFAVWQRERLDAGELERQLTYWLASLGGAPAVLDLPTDRPRPAFRAQLGGRSVRRWSARRTDDLAALARSHRVTLFMALLAGVECLLARLTGQPDLLVGAAVAGRSLPEIEPLIGHFVNTLVFRARLAEAPSGADLLARIRAETLAALDHQELPFERLVAALRPERDPSRAPLVQAMLVVDTFPAGLLALPAEVEGDRLVPGAAVAKYDLVFDARLEGDRLRLAIDYSAGLFDATTVERMQEHLENLLVGLAAEPRRAVSRLPMLAEGERFALLREWNDTQARFPSRVTVDRLFAEQADRYPERTAVVAGDDHLSYGGLEQSARRLAALLRRRGVAPGVPVALVADRSVSMVVALVAILRAGGCYVPLDPEWPAERLAFVLSDLAPPVVLAEPRRRDALPASAATVLSLGGPEVPREEAAGGESGEDGAGSAPGAGALDLAYVLYTSGSTGEPKGVAVPHRAVVRLVRQDGFARLDGEETYLQLAPLPFDASTLELWAPLLNGGTLVVMPPGAPTLEELASAIERHRVTTLWLTAGLFHQMVDEHLPSLAGLRQLIAGGDVLSPPHVHALRQGAPALRLVNGYGPTEGTTFTCCHTIVAADLDAGSVPIGRPILNTRVHLLDRALEPVPIGVAGELFLGGDGVARCYALRPRSTAERFVPDPFAEAPGERLYRTGDRVCRKADGRMEFLGRLDQQVKLRGFRIELGEIEAVLARHPAVGEAAVVVRAAAEGDRRLVAFATPRSAAEPPQGADLRRFLERTLPAFMVPARYVVLDALPLNASGKVDRRALLGMEGGEAGAGGGPAGGGPRTPLEGVVASLWAGLLGLDELGVEQDVFALGAHSLLATQLASRARQALGVELGLKAIFAHPTVAGLAAEVERLRSAERGFEPPAMEPVRRDRPLPLSFAQERMWLFEQLHPGGSTYNTPFAAEVGGRPDVRALGASFTALLERHEALRTTFVAQRGEPSQVVLPPARCRLPVIDLRRLPVAARGAEAERLRRREARQPFALSRGPLFRCRLLRLAADEHLLLVTMHHIAFDGWSIGIFVRELEELYRGFTVGETPRLPALPLQYADFACWQRRWLQGEVLERHLDYWRSQLGASPPVLELPTDRPRPPVQTFAGASRPVTVDPSLARGLGDLARREGATLFMPLAAAFLVLLHRCSDQDRISLGSPIANRTRVEIEGLVGFFVNTLVLCTDLSGDPTFRELLARVREVTLGAYDHQDLPFEHLVARLVAERDPSRQPLFQAMLVLQNAPRNDLDLPGLSLRALGGGGYSALTDLTLSLTETGPGIEGLLIYNRDLFDPTTAMRWSAQLGRLLGAAVESPELRISDLPLLSPAERHQCLVEWPAEEAWGTERCTAALRSALSALEGEAAGDRWPRSSAAAGDRGSGLRLLDRGLDAVAIGASGWLWLALDAAGAGPAFGPEGARRALASLLPDPLAERPGGLLLATRARARQLRDGRLAHPSEGPQPAPGQASLAAAGPEAPVSAEARQRTVNERRAQLSDARRSLLQKWAAKKTPAPPATGAIPRRSETGPSPLSFGQERLWFLEEILGGVPVYNVPLRLGLRSRRSPAVLERCLAEIVRRHEVLRSRFEHDGEQAVQQVLEMPTEAPEPGLRVIDLAALAVPERAAEAARLALREACTPFDLGRPPLLRALLVRQDGECADLDLTTHHIAFDGHSTGVLVGEIDALYAAFAAGRPSPLPELPVQYADFALWQRQRLDAPHLAPLLDFWRAELAGAPTGVVLPTDRPHRDPAEPRAGFSSFTVGPELTGRLGALARDAGTTLFVTLLAAFGTLLERLTSQEDLLIGAPMVNRDRVELQPLIGFFTNTLVLRVRPRPEETARELLRELRESVVGAFRHQEMPFEKLVQELAPEREAGRQPLVQVVFALDADRWPGGLPAGSLVSEVGELDSGFAKFDMTLAMVESGPRLTGTLDYRADLFDATTVGRLAASFERLLAALAAEPDRRLRDLPLLGAGERAQVLREWNDSAPTAEEPRCVHEQVGEQARRRPEAVAVVHGAQHWTYGELVRRAGRLARLLRAAGLRPEMPVAVSAERSFDLVVAMLGVLAAGGSYLPLDPASPLQRLAGMVVDSGASLLLTDGRRPHPTVDGVRVIELGGDRLTDARDLAPEMPERAAEAAGLAYVIYTSGSTGAPKGVGSTHRGLSNLVAWHLRRYALCEADRASQVAAIGFDAMAWETWPCLACGASLHLAPAGVAADPAALVEWLADAAITIAFLPTPLAEALLAEERPALPALRALLTGGDRLQPLSAAPPLPLSNHYGVTEAAVVTTVERVTAGGADLPAPAIGRPISGTQAYVLDRSLQPQPPGIVGTLHVGGEGVARGYLGRAAATAESFLPDPFSTLAGARLFATGDRVRHLADGRIAFLGRADHQVKIRGARIELGEVEAALRRHPAVRECVVVLREDRPGERRLAAYVVPAPGAGEVLAELRARLRAELPEAMVPTAWAALPALPLSANGKVDRGALPAPAEGSRAAPGSRRATGPRDEVEAALLGIWEEVLGGGPVGVGDSFFDLGGHSLLAVRLTASIRRRLGVDLPLAALFAAPTVEGLAARLRRGASPVGRDGLVPLQERGARPAFFCVHPVGGTVACYVPLARRLGRAFFGLQAPEAEGSGPDGPSIEELAASHLAAVRARQPEGPYLLGGWSMGGAVAYEMACQLDAAGARVGLLALIDAYLPEAAVPLPDRAALQRRFVSELCGLFGEPGEPAVEAPIVGRMAGPLEQLLAVARSRSWLPPGGGRAEIDRLYGRFERNWRAFHGYRPRPFAGALELFLAHPPAAGAADPSPLWAALAAGETTVHRLPGDHWGLMREPLVESLAAALRTRIEATGAGGR